jgi:hypothetical protein
VQRFEPQFDCKGVEWARKRLVNSNGNINLNFKGIALIVQGFLEQDRNALGKNW